MADDGKATKKDEDTALAADGEEDALLGLAEESGGSGGRRATPRLPEEPGSTPGDEDDDVAPRPEGGLHALGQLGTAVVIVAALVVVFLIVAGALGFIFH